MLSGEDERRDKGVADRVGSLDELSDGALLEAVRAGQKEALALLFRRHRDPIYRYLFGLTRQRELAEDLLQDTFLRLWRQGDRLPQDTRMAYVYRIAVNLVRDHVRRAREHPGLPPDWERRVSNDSQSMDRVADVDLVSRALAELSPDQRLTVGLHYFADQSVERVGHILGIPTGTVKTRLSRAYRQLAEVIARQEGQR